MVKNELKPVGKYRGKAAATEGMINKAVQIISNMKSGYDIWVSHIDDEANADYMRAQLARKLELNLENIKTVEIGSTIAAHAGPGCCGWAILPH
jgi:fatty acid-binding protein DegV